MDTPAVLIPDSLRRVVTDLHGRAGAEWFGRLPETLAACAGRWGLELGRAFEPVSYNYVLRAARADGTRVVLKVGFPGRELAREAAALRHFDGRGCARLLESDLEAGALLIARLEPGTSLVELANDEQDDEATRAAAVVMRELWRAAPERHDFPTAADWAEGFGRLRSRFGGGCGPLPEEPVAEAEALFRELLDAAPEPLLLHADLHHGNILAAGRGRWLAIDPQGLIAEPAYEAGALLRNPLPQLFRARRPVELLSRRLDTLAAELNLDRARLRAWGRAQAVLSAWWSIEDHGAGWEPAMELFRLLSATRP
ncbi:MAG TPA: aminoglycoside phosphotransferase family protein [Pyrinomonadaceae bacterium]|nr:aminoglycoside phosphotransferase family protein [Pyrinomonadaceae bacterium]